jgi:hypothetical protein
VARQWRDNLDGTLNTLNALVDQLADGWALLVEDALRSAAPRSPGERAPQRDRYDSDRYDSPALPFVAGQVDPMERALRRQARQAGILPAPAEFAARVRLRLPADPPPFDIVSFNPYRHLRAHAPLMVGALSFAALLTFGSSWLIAIVEPSLAFAILATLVSLVLLLAHGLRFAWETLSGAAGNPALLFLAMFAPVVGTLVVATQLPRLSARLSALREA